MLIPIDQIEFSQSARPRPLLDKLPVVDCAEMANQEPRRARDIQDLTSRVDRLEAKSNEPMNFWAKTLVGIIVAYLGFLGVMLFTVHGRISSIEGELKSLPAKLAQESLEQSQRDVSKGNLEQAARGIQSAQHFLRVARKNKSLVEAAYFEQISQNLSQLASFPQLSEEVHNTRIQLADYKSVLERAPALRPQPFTIVGSAKADDITQLRLGPPDLTKLPTLLKVTPGDIIFYPFSAGPLTEGPWISHIALKGGVDGVTQTLDGIHWVEDVFINVRVRYKGGEVQLTNVRFVDCTFDIPPVPRGSQVLSYAILGKPEQLILDQNAVSSLLLQTLPMSRSPLPLEMPQKSGKN